MNVHLLILAILREAGDQGVAPMLRTTLVKFFYLLDVYTAENSAGTPVSDVEWRFLHFGPYSYQVADAIDELSNQGVIFADHRKAEAGNKEFVLYHLNNRQRAGDLRQLGIPGTIQTRLHADMKRYARDLPRLLNYVYFHTAPMFEARPGDVLDFSGCLKMTIEDVKPIEMNKLRSRAIKKTRTKLRKLIQARKSQEQIEQGPYDDTYFSSLSILDGESLETGFAGRAKLSV
ncbi:hypothetical protein [Candidatus Thiosymbion oneisti]|uniref:hypothetical protein n=1 Tax=Candidatus Thiosymbion oneisti TaxID=589554 RepID=UPI00114CF027|nr:hypothetical protein [Candidatus Thiosymbion oneisti]